MSAWRRTLFAAGLALASAAPAAAQAFTSGRVVKAQGYLSFDRVPPGSSFRLAVAAKIDDGWHINAHNPTLDYLIPTSLSIEKNDGMQGLTFDEPIYPGHVERAFEFTAGEKLRVYEGTVLIGVEGKAAKDLAPGARSLRCTLTVQACNDKSCLAPAKLTVEIPLPIAGPGEPVNAVNGDIFGSIKFAGGAFPAQATAEGLTAGAQPDGAGPNDLGRSIRQSGWLATLGLIFLSGLALNLTPCVYPLIPITLAYFGGQAAGKPSQTFKLASMYVLGMCLTYSALGALAATTGSVLGSALQSPVSLMFVALVMVALALSMFGLYDIQVPLALRRFVMSRPGASGALFMGLTVGLVAAPCVGPFVVSLLAYVGRAGSPLLGFSLFFVLALGLGVPFLVLGGFAGAATGLPKAGAWMDWVKKVFGCILIAMAFYFINPLLPKEVARFMIPIVLLASGLYLGFVEGSPVRGVGFRTARFSTALVCAAIAVWLMLPVDAAAGVRWEPYSDEALHAAQAARRPVMIDFTADWCLPCKELDHYTFSDQDVVAASRGFFTLKADITSTLSPPVEALKNRYEILGAPTIVFLDATGQERRDLRLTGFEKAPEFLERMRKVL